VAQAWGVAEVMKEYELYDAGKDQVKKKKNSGADVIAQ